MKYRHVILIGVDGAGHGYGYNTSKYLEQLDIVDGYVGRIRESVERAGIADDTLVMKNIRAYRPE